MAEQQDKTKYNEALRYHGQIVKEMHEIGYGLMLDGDTFYQLGYERDPLQHTTFTVRQAYAICNALEAAQSRAKAEADERFEAALPNLKRFAPMSDTELIDLIRQRYYSTPERATNEMGGK